MGNKASQKSIGRHGIPIRSVHEREVFEALMAQAKLLRQNVGTVVAGLCKQWFEDDWSWYLEQQKKK